MAKQNVREKLIRNGLQVLKGEGLPVEEPSAAAIAPLKERLGATRSTDLAVVHLLGRIANEASVQALRELAAEATDKDVKREIRRSLFRLAQKGFAASAGEAEARDASKPRFSLAPEIEGYLSPVDGKGNYLLVLARPQVGGGLFVIQAAVNDRLGLQRIGGTVIRRKEFRQMLSEMKAEHGITLVPIPWEYADWRLHGAYEEARSRGSEGIEEYPRLRSHVTNAEVKPQPHPVFNTIDREEIAGSTELASTRNLLAESEFKTWVLDEDLIAPYVERAAELKDSRIVLSSAQQGQRFEGIVRDAVEGVFLDEGLRPIFQRRLEDIALHLELSERKDKARSVLRVAAALERREVGGLMGIPLLDELVRRSLGLYMAQEREEKAAEPSLIIKP